MSSDFSDLSSLPLAHCFTLLVGQNVPKEINSAFDIKLLELKRIPLAFPVLSLDVIGRFSTL